MFALYDLILLLVYPLLWLFARFHRRLKLNFELRKALPDFSAARGKTHIWFHAASAGEFEQVRAVAIAMRKKYRNLFFSFSYFSDSTYRTRQNDTVPDLLFALPFDFSWRMRALVKLMQPAALFIGKYDAWPNQVRAACRAGVPVYLVSATLPAASRRYRFPLRVFLRPVYAAMKNIFAVNEEHANRLRYISPSNVVALGDTRFDAIAARLAENREREKQLSPLRRALANSTVIVGGSTYATSAAMLIGYAAANRKLGGRNLKIILAPHHLREEKLAAVEALCNANALRSARFSRAGKTEWDVLIIDGFGLLPYLYPLAQIAYVGGGFEGSVHSVIEAAIAGIPVITGPAIHNSAEALDLSRENLLHVMAQPDSAALAEAVEYLWKNRKKLGAGMKSYFRERLGVSNEIVHTVMDDISEKKERV